MSRKVAQGGLRELSREKAQHGQRPGKGVRDLQGLGPRVGCMEPSQEGSHLPGLFPPRIKGDPGSSKTCSGDACSVEGQEPG